MPGRVKLAVLVALIILLGFLRDFFFVNINWIFLHLTEGRPNQAVATFDALLQWTPAQILTLKWVLTFVFTGLFFGMTYWIIRSAFNNRLFNRITVLSFAGLLALSALLYLAGFLTGNSENLYGIIRTIMGIAQSFMPLMILYILFKFLPGPGQPGQ